jgi:hypothetical protein
MYKHIIIYSLIAVAFVLLVLQFPAPKCDAVCRTWHCSLFQMFPDGMLCQPSPIRKVGFDI